MRLIKDTEQEYIGEAGREVGSYKITKEVHWLRGEPAAAPFANSSFALFAQRIFPRYRRLLTIFRIDNNRHGSAISEFHEHIRSEPAGLNRPSQICLQLADEFFVNRFCDLRPG